MAGRPAVFISYKRDHEPSLALVAQLEAALAGEFDVLRDVGIAPGDRWSDELWRWLMECSAAIAVVSDEATASDWCRREWSVLAARQAHSDLRVIPVQLDAATSDILAHLQAVPGGDVDAIVARLQGVRAAPPSPRDFLAAHQAWLRWLYDDAPALGGQPFALGDVYVDTECGALTWEQLSSDRSIDPFDEEHGGRVSLLDTVLGHLGDPGFDDLVVVQGPAGSGKSAFTLRLARHLIDEGLRPVVVRFRDLRLSTYDDLDAQLQDAVRVGPVGEHPPPTSGSVFADDVLGETVRFGDATISRTVVILDGWDEVDLTGNLPFRDQIERWLPRVRQRFTHRPGPPVRLLLTGRPSTVVDRSDLLRKPTPVLTVRPMRPDQLRDYADHISARLAAADWSLDPARCEEAFASYARWFEQRGDEGTDVLGSPLLALLAFRTLAEPDQPAADLFAVPSALYRALIDVTTKHAGKAGDSPEGTVHRGGPELRRLLQRVATVITHRGRESVSAEELRLRLEDDGALEDWARRATGESTLHELVVNFYFKSHPELGCEFLHKSFREYLHAESIVSALEAAIEDKEGPLPVPDVDDKHDFPEGTLHRRASRSLARLLCPQWLIPEVRTHTFWLMTQRSAAARGQWIAVRDLLADVYNWWARRVHLRSHAERRRGQLRWHPPPIVELLEDTFPLDETHLAWTFSTTSADAAIGRSLIQLTAHAHATVADAGLDGRRHQSSDSEGRIRFRPFGAHPASLVARLTAPGQGRSDGLADTYLGPADLRHTDLRGVDMRRIDLGGADLRESNLAGARLLDANLRGAALAGADLIRAELCGVDLGGADLRGVRLELADLYLADLRSATLDGCDGGGADLASASLQGASLTGAHLAQADLRGAQLDRARIVGADLTRANLIEAVLIEADLSGASLYYADLTGADLTDADVRDADLTNAVLSDAELSGADLRGSLLPEDGSATSWPMPP